jgi:hypothetical protein
VHVWYLTFNDKCNGGYYQYLSKQSCDRYIQDVHSTRETSPVNDEIGSTCKERVSNNILQIVCLNLSPPYPPSSDPIAADVRSLKNQTTPSPLPLSALPAQCCMKGSDLILETIYDLYSQACMLGQ